MCRNGGKVLYLSVTRHIFVVRMKLVPEDLRSYLENRGGELFARALALLEKHLKEMYLYQISKSSARWPLENGAGQGKPHFAQS